MEQGPSWQADSDSPVERNTPYSTEPKVSLFFHNTLPLVPTLSLMNTFHISQPIYCHPSIYAYALQVVSFLQVCRPQIYTFLMYAKYMPISSYLISSCLMYLVKGKITNIFL